MAFLLPVKSAATGAGAPRINNSITLSCLPANSNNKDVVRISISIANSIVSELGWKEQEKFSLYLGTGADNGKVMITPSEQGNVILKPVTPKAIKYSSRGLLVTSTASYPVSVESKPFKAEVVEYVAQGKTLTISAPKLVLQDLPRVV